MVFKALAGVLAWFVGAGVCPAAPSTVAYESEIAPGLVVESVVKGRQADRLGMHPGDIVYSLPPAHSILSVRSVPE